MSSNPKIRFADAKLFLPKIEDCFLSTKTFDVCIEDFLEKLNGDAEKVEDNEDFIQSPDIVIGDHLVSLGIYKEAGSIWLGVRTLGVHLKEMNIILKLLEVEGVCGNAPVKGKSSNVVCHLPGNDSLAAELEKIEHLKDAMTTSGNHKLDLQVDLIIEESGWIVTR